MLYRNYSLLVLASLFLLDAGGARAQEAPPPAPTPDSEAVADEAAPRDVVVVGRRRRTDDVLGEVRVLSGDDLAAAAKPTLGETLAAIPGVAIGGSGPNVGKPVIRGLSGTRVRTLIDGISSLDVSASSSDHAEAVNPLLADSIEVVHGAASLVFGASAVGGVIDVVDSRIPRKTPDGVAFSGRAGLSSVDEGRELSARVDAPLAGRLVGHLDATYEKRGDTRIAGPVLSDALRAEARASADPDVRALADLGGRLPNSDGETKDGAVAIALVDGRLNAGLSVARRESFYGVPIRYSLDPSEEAEAVHIDLAQTRVDARVEVPLEGFLDSVKLRGGHSDYRHREVEEDGAVGSIVRSNGGEVRLDAVQNDRAGWGGRSGVQLFDVRQSIDGDEKYLPPVRSKQVSLFTVQHVDAGPLRLEAGARIERVSARATADAATGNPDLSRRFHSLSLSGGASLKLAGATRLAIDVNRSQRAPSVEELYANGPHGGNAIYELGDPGLGLERNLGVELGLHHHRAPLDFDVVVYRNRFANFLYRAPTGAVVDGLPVYAARQGEATYRGIEAQADLEIGEMGGIVWTAGLRGDHVRATIDGVGPAPLTPPLRVGARIEGKRGTWNAFVDVERNAAQRRTAPLESETDGFTLVSAGIDWKPLARLPDLTVSLEGENLLDANGRRATSLLKDYAPIGGRGIKLGVRFAI